MRFLLLHLTALILIVNVWASQDILQHLALSMPNNKAQYVRIGKFKPGNALLRNFAGIDLKQATQNVALYCYQTEQFSYHFKDARIVDNLLEATKPRLGYDLAQQNARLEALNFIEKQMGSGHVKANIINHANFTAVTGSQGNYKEKKKAISNNGADIRHLLIEAIHKATSQLWSTTSQKFENTCREYKRRWQDFLHIVRNSYSVKVEEGKGGLQNNHFLTALRIYENHLRALPTNLKTMEDSYQHTHSTIFGNGYYPTDSKRALTGTHFRKSLDYDEVSFFESIQQNSKVKLPTPWSFGPCEIYPSLRACTNNSKRKRRSVTQLSEWLDRQFNICPANENITHTNVSLNKRKKRFALLAIGSVIASTIALATSFSNKIHDEQVLKYLVDQDEVKRKLLKKLVVTEEIMADNTKMLADKIDEQHTTLMSLIQGFELKTYQDTFRQAELQMLITQGDLENMISKYEQSYPYFRAQKVPIPLVSVSQLKKVYESAKKQASANGQMLYALQADALLTYKCMLVWLIGQPFLVLEIPLYDKQSQEFDLMRLSDQSIVHGNYSYQIDLPRRNVLINRDLTLFRELTDSEVKMCDQMELSYLNCPSLPPMFYKDTTNNCHISLLTDRINESIMKICNIKMHPKEHDILRRPDGKYELFSRTPTVANKRCANGENSENINFGPESKVIELDSGCSLETNFLKTFNSRDSIMSQSITTRAVDLRLDVMLSNLGYRNSKALQLLDDKLMQLSKQKSLKSVSFNEIHHLLNEDRKMKEDFQHPHFFIHPYLPIAIGGFLLIIMIIGFCWGRKSIKKTRARYEPWAEIAESNAIRVRENENKILKNRSENERIGALTREILQNPHAPRTQENKRLYDAIEGVPPGENRNPNAIGNTYNKTKFIKIINKKAAEKKADEDKRHMQFWEAEQNELLRELRQ